MRLIIFLSFFISMTFCKNKKENINSNDRILVKFKDKELKLSDISDLLINARSKSDSDQIIIAYSNEWTKKQIYLDLSEKYLAKDKSEIEKQVQNYKENLLIYMYQNAYVADKLDTNVTNEQIKEYLKTHKMEIKLEEDIIKAFLIQIPKSYLSNKVKKNLNLSELSERKIGEICEKFAFKCIDYSNHWVSLNFFLSYISNGNLILDISSGTDKVIEVSDSNFVYFIKVKNFKKSGDLMPEDYVAEQLIKPYVIAERKKKILKDLEKIMLENYIKNNKLEFYYK